MGTQDGDFDPLVGGKIRSNTAKERAFFLRHWKWILPMIALAILAFCKGVSSFAGDVGKVDKKSTRQCPEICKSKFNIFKQKWGGDLSQASTMLQRAEEERGKLVTQLKQDYGEKYFPLFFLDAEGRSIGRTGFHGGDRTSNVSRNRYIRKFMMKILSVQMAVQKETSNASGCDCQIDLTGKRYLQGSSKASDVDEPEDSLLDELPDHYAKMVWVNGGHSSAAGHGNMFNETYTAVMERSAKDAFAAVGIELIGRNYAMGGMPSAPELALCAEAVYGLDADLITWNFGMTDGGEWWRHSLYGNRRGAHRNRPLLLDIDAGLDKDDNMRLRILKELEEAGLATMFMAISYMYDHNSQDFIPDTQQLTQQEIYGVPEFLRYFKCGEGLEKGEPLCSDRKYTHECPPHKAPWHPGWKANALMGNILALFMIDVLVDALKELDSLEGPTDLQKLFEQLQRDEDKDYDMFSNSTIEEHDFAVESWEEDLSLLYRSPTVCHTALLPAETRYRGILTEMENSSFEAHDIGTQKAVIDTQDEIQESIMSLVYEEKVDCPVPVSIDYKDWFYATDKTGVSKLTVPNKAEKRAYMYSGQKFHGLIVVCLVSCDWDQCEPGDMRPPDVAGGNVTLTVNGHHVKEMVDIPRCAILRGEQGFVWEPNERGEYDLRAHVHYPGGYFRISSVILI